MALDLELDTTTHDLILDARGELELVGDDPLIEQLGQTSTFGELVAQRLRYGLRTQLGEWYLDARDGVDWLGIVLGKAPDIGAVRAELLRVISATEGVDSIESLTLSRDALTRRLDVAFRVLSDDAVVEATGTLPDITITIP